MTKHGPVFVILVVTVFVASTEGAQCSGTVMIDGMETTSGIISNPSPLSGNYANSAWCFWNITTAPDVPIIFYVQSIQIISPDFTAIWEKNVGVYLSEAVAAYQASSFLTDDSWPYLAYATCFSGYSVAHFASDGVVVGRGIEYRWSRWPVPTPSGQVIAAMTTRQTLFSSIPWDGDRIKYATPATSSQAPYSSSWLISSSAKVYFEFQTYNLAANDTVMVFDGPNSTYPILFSFDSNSVFPTANQSLFSSGTSLFVEFNVVGDSADPGINPGNPGFAAFYNSVVDVGVACAFDYQCYNKACHLGLCFAHVCTGPCENYPSSALASCDIEPDCCDPSPTFECGENVACSSTTFCGAASCAGHMLTPAGQCDGGFSCVTPAASPCSDGFACQTSGLACHTGCALDSHCQSGLICSKNACVSSTSTSSFTPSSSSASSHSSSSMSSSLSSTSSSTFISSSSSSSLSSSTSVSSSSLLVSAAANSSSSSSSVTSNGASDTRSATFVPSPSSKENDDDAFVDSNKGLGAIIIGGIVAAVGVCLFGLFMAVIVIRRSLDKKEETDDEVDSFESGPLSDVSYKPVPGAKAAKTAKASLAKETASNDPRHDRVYDGHLEKDIRRLVELLEAKEAKFASGSKGGGAPVAAAMQGSTQNAVSLKSRPRSTSNLNLKSLPVSDSASDDTEYEVEGNSDDDVNADYDDNESENKQGDEYYEYGYETEYEEDE